LLLAPDLFYREDAFAQLGVGKNMAQSIRHWGRVCSVFERAATGDEHKATPLGHALLADDGWDPFLVTPASRWLLHWQIASRPQAAFTFFYTFNLLKGGEFDTGKLAQQIQDYVAERERWKIPSDATILRDVECMLNCYCRPNARQLAAAAEDLLLCPLADLGLIQALPGRNSYRLAQGAQPDLPDTLFAYTVAQMMRRAERGTISFSDLAYAPFSPGRVFRLDPDSVLSRLQRIDEATSGQAYYSEQAGIRQVAWPNVADSSYDTALLAGAFTEEARYV
jgi:hypothetical protein